MKNDDDANSFPTIAPTTPATAEGLKLTCKFVRPQRGGRVRIVEPGDPAASEPPEKVKTLPIPTIVRALVRAHAYERLIRSGTVASYVEVAAMVKQTTARISQLAMLLNLAPDIQAEILGLAALENRGVIVDEKEVRRIANEPEWTKQREAWRAIRFKSETAPEPTVGVAGGQSFLR